MRWHTTRLMDLGPSGMDATDWLERELVEERAAALGRLGRELEVAMTRWRRVSSDPETTDRRRRRALAEVGRATWLLMVQREACGFHRDNLDGIRRTYGVPEQALPYLGATGEGTGLLSNDRTEITDTGIPPLRRPARWRR